MNSNMEYRQYLINNSKKILKNNNSFYCELDNLKEYKSSELNKKNNISDLQENYLKEYKKLSNQISTGIMIVKSYF